MLWDHGPASLGHICTSLRQQRDVATTTVATMLKVMLEKSLVKRDDGPRGYLWTATVTRRAATSGLVGKLVERVFDGSAHRLVAHLVESGQLTRDELEELRKLAGDRSSKNKPRRRRK